MTTTDPTWIFDGAEVAVTTGGLYGWTTFERIDRLTATQIVLVDGRKYRRGSNHQEIGAKHTSTMLVDPHSPVVVAYFAREQLRNIVRHGEGLVRGSSATIHKMTPAQVREELDTIADMVDTARKEIDRRAGL